MPILEFSGGDIWCHLASPEGRCRAALNCPGQPSSEMPGRALMALVAIRRKSAAVLTALAMILLGVALEFGQKLSPGRSCEIRDMFINGAGVVTGIAIGILSRRITRWPAGVDSPARVHFVGEDG